ncbi:hypothetical protein [Edaphobacter aggregans]|uniref:hypothetical protein n=1 Tax=Edaphobacter aggregans TaxID=570835 RepID=UPI00068AFDE6|nr:hypothetical protein [Edaphobacter aggregans]
MPRKLPMLALALFTASSFAVAQTSNKDFFTRYFVAKRRHNPTPSTNPPTTTPPTTTDPAPSGPSDTDPAPTTPTTPAPAPTTPTTPDPAPTTPTTPAPAPTAPQLACNAMSLGVGANLNGFLPFEANNPWRQNIANAPVDGNSNGYIGFLGGSHLRANFGAGQYNGSTIGIPYTVVGGSPFTTINYNLYGDESDPGPMPISTDTPVEGYPNPGDGDRHTLVLDRDNCWLYELGVAVPQGDGTWQANVGSVWDLLNQNARPFRWTSTDAAGLPVFPGLVRYDEVAAGHIDHAIRVTLQRSRQAFVPPATHWAPNNSDPNAAPMGMRMRLKANFDISSYGPQAKVILTALKNYGMIMADNGSNMFMIGAPDDRWNNDDLNSLKQVPASAFEVIQMPVVYTQSNVPTGPAPTITSLTADKTTVGSGQAVTLTWAANNASYYVVSPEIGAVRGTSAVVHPTKTTTYTVYATNQFDRSTQTITINVQ